jgi:hypothetical protein
MSESYFALEEQIDNALNTITDNQKPNIAKLSHDFCIPYQRLRARWLGRECQTGGQNKALKDCEELALCQILDRMEKAVLVPVREHQTSGIMVLRDEFLLWRGPVHRFTDFIVVNLCKA